MSLGARIKAARTAKKLSQTEIADSFGISRNAVSLWESDATQPETNRLPQLANLLQVPMDWLLSGGDAPIPPGSAGAGPVIIRPAGSEPSEVVKVGEGWPDVGDEWMDVRGVTVGGDDSFFYFGDVIDQVRRPPGIRNAKNVAALNVAGESMVPRFKSGELIYVQQRLAAPGDDVVVELYPENEGDAPKAFLKEMTRRTGRRIYCKQHNPPADIEFDAGEVKTVWRVLTMRDLLG
jgi:phage repressor protein C with HTH and peptisase S24 domain